MNAWIISLAGILLLGTLGIAVFLGWFRRRRPIPLVEELCPKLETAKSRAAFPAIRWLGHSSFRIDWAGRVVLIDPVIASHVSVAPRLMKLPDASVLEGVDDVLLSHGHMDHMDSGTLAQFADARIFLPAGSDVFLPRGFVEKAGIHPFKMESRFRCGELSVSVVPAIHGGWRYPWQRGYFACGFVLTDGQTTLYYAGDTAWGPHFSSIAAAHAPDISILPIGGYSPRWFLQKHHMDPGEAAEAIDMLGSRFNIPCHFGTYRVSLEPIDEPLKRFRAALDQPSKGDRPVRGSQK